ncbi:DUF922 domain-containing protein [Wohlfahrtiimonas larvae]|uniref:DUF922 domain-containing protein n=1 Tax=Wohlfahrtiimonas larvae TaxID=1157986 RepID=A0ABP9N031_9GAMM|nr:DUF922 domain-containing protein [Wohlfahrtiimonas larvae]
MRKFLLVVFVAFSSPFTYSVTIDLMQEYYDVVPLDVDNIRISMMHASHLSDVSNAHHTIGNYIASTTVDRMVLVHEQGQCHASVFEMKLNGTMTLPRLAMGNYPLKLRQAFEDELNMLEQHEKTHERIWQTALEAFENDIQQLIVPDNQNCDQFINEINQKMIKVLDDIGLENLKFDCISYGKHLNFTQCNENY